LTATDNEAVQLFPGTALVIMVAQVVEGAPTCQCGAPAVLDIVTDPDGEPGLVCWECGRPWWRMVRKLIGDLVGATTPPA
jgi:hypothetical protein